MRATEMHGRDHRWVGFALPGRRRGDDARHTGDRGGGDRHMRGRNHRELAAWDIAAHGLDGDVLVPEDHTRERFDLDI